MVDREGIDARYTRPHARTFGKRQAVRSSIGAVTAPVAEPPHATQRWYELGLPWWGN